MASKVSISEAVGLTGVSESTIRRDIKSGKVSSEKDAKGHRRIDIAELQRVYTVEPTPDRQTTGVECQHIIGLLETQVADLKAQLEKSETRENRLIEERTKLLDLLAAEKEEKRALMPAIDDRKRKSPSWLLRLVGVREPVDRFFAKK